ncbi:MAG: glycosyltransferase family 39 protein [Pyrinomonadaceae bacterium MAG19_C2-C3]|nr:glycosyltransferase family 39 protein [Pyrinomonadaceae bacterium MAG19_C2-C3]
MDSLLIIALILAGVGISLFVPEYGAPAVLLCSVLASGCAVAINRMSLDRNFLLRLFACSLVLRMLLGTVTFQYNLETFFGPDAPAFDDAGFALLQVWKGNPIFRDTVSAFAGSSGGAAWGMIYMVAAIYGLVGRNMLAVQFVNAILGAATSVFVYMCAHHTYHNVRVARLSALIVAFFPSLVLWSSIAMKDAPIVFMLVVAMYATLKLGEKLSVKYLIVLSAMLLGILSFRFYIFYMLVAAIGGAFVVGMREVTAQSFARQLAIIACLGMAMTYWGVYRTATTQIETYANLEAVQRSRSYLSGAGQSGFAEDDDVSTMSGAVRALPKGFAYLLFAPFPWEFGSLRQSFALPEMLIWYALFPLFVLGTWFTIRFRLRQALPILLFTSLLTFAYALTQGNIGTAYRQRAQLLVFYFIFAAVGAVLLIERREDKR